MKKVPSLFFIGGFLGAGKTTAIVSLAKLFAEKGLKAAAITNDQADQLVDTVFLAGEGVPAFAATSLDYRIASITASSPRIPT